MAMITPKAAMGSAGAGGGITLGGALTTVILHLIGTDNTAPADEEGPPTGPQN